MQTTDNSENEWEPISASLPQARVKKIMKLDKEVGSVQYAALLRMSCAAEVFLELLTMEAAKLSDKDKRKTITYKDLAQTITSDERFAFLSELIPKPMPLAEALEFQRKKEAELEDKLGMDDDMDYGDESKSMSIKGDDNDVEENDGSDEKNNENGKKSRAGKGNSSKGRKNNNSNTQQSYSKLDITDNDHDMLSSNIDNHQNGNHLPTATTYRDDDE